MSAKIIDGKAVAQKVYENLVPEIDRLGKHNVKPHLTVVLVGEDPASVVYVGMKQKACEKWGLSSETIRLSEDISEQDLLNLVEKLNNDPSVHGILVQLPLPAHINSKKVLDAINPDKDVDGFHPVNRGRLAVGEECFAPCTPAGIQQLLVQNDIDPAGKHLVVLGRSAIVGMPFAIMMMQKKPGANATVTVCHTGTKDVAKHTQQADILVAAAGHVNAITKEMVKPGAVVIDVGSNRVDDPSAKRGFRLVGDIDFNEVKEVAGAITPVPGGVGPMTIAMLVYNTVQAAKRLSS